MPVILLFCELPPSYGWRFWSTLRPMLNSTTRQPVWVDTAPKTTPTRRFVVSSKPITHRSTPVWKATTPRPTPSRPKISKKRCGSILDNLPHYLKEYDRSRPLCVRRNESQLFERLKDVGGWNPRFVALNREQACKFKDLSENAYALKKNSSGRRPYKSAQPRQKRTLRGCWSQGYVPNGSNLRHLCTECSATTQLPANVFPPFINEAICGDADRFCYRRIGRCVQKFIQFTFLRSTGEFERNDDLSNAHGVDIYEEEFETFDQNIRSCCECRMFSFVFGGR